MNKKLLYETKEIIDAMPDEKLKVVYCFIKWIAEEKISQEELKSITAGEKEIDSGATVPWRAIARTI